jgi:nuclear pore complex protein Nup98-Nup96
MFGGSNTNTSGGFGSGTSKSRLSTVASVDLVHEFPIGQNFTNVSLGGFGSNTGGGFGSKPAFGSSNTTTGGGMFGGANNTQTTSGFGGFGSNNANTASPFGGTANTTSGGGLFGGNKTGFGSSTSNTGSSLFGGGATTNTTSGFGSGGGFGASNTAMGGGGDPPGSAVTPFQAFTEKEPNSATTNSFQNILFQEPYKKWSAEELRLVDYTQGRRHGNGNASGGGAFGVNSGFGGGFGANNQQQQQNTSGFGGTSNTTGGGLFGSSNNTNTTGTGTGTGFGQTANTGFGANSNTSGGGLFGQNKPAGGGLFGSSNNQAQQSGGGGLFGSGGTGFGNNTNTGGGFGSSTTNTGGGLFGGNNQNKPAGTGFGFGNTANNTTTSGFGGSSNTGFGGGTNTGSGGGLFGNTSNTQQGSGGGLFGNQQQQQQQQQPSTGSGFGGFGQQNNQNQAGQTGGGLFGNQGAKPATGGGLFGSSSNTTNTGGGLFGSANANQSNTSGFGGTTSSGGGLFGAAKPATGGGLFGGSTNTQSGTSGGGLFGGLGSNNQQQQQQQQQGSSGGLFGGANNNQQKPGGLFGSSTQSTGGGLFGSQNQNQGSSVFGGGNQQQNQQGSGFGGSLLGNSQQGSVAPQGLTANLNDVSAYGTPSLFAGLGGNETPNPGPLATPLNGNSKPRKSSILPMYKLAPSSSSRFATPQKRGFGFSYSSYGTPGGSPASISSTPGALGRSLLGSSGNLSKSMSTNNLRRQFNTEDSILAPGAFSSSSNTRWYGSTGSKKLIINREIRSDLFTTPQKEKQDGENGTGRKLNKRVSFDTSNVDSDETTTPVRALPAPEDSPSTQAEDTPRQNKPNGPNGNNTPEADQPSGKELAIVQEEDGSQAAETYAASGFDNAPGQYWMQPSKDELQSMNRIQRQKVDGFTVGRDNVGYIKFKIPVDISSIDLDEICGGIIQLEPRSATVYPIAAKKPPVGKGLNVPSRISLEQSWPRGGRDKRVTSDPKRFNKHIERLKRITDTTFESYDKDTGVWTFSVEHFTTYGLDDSDDETDADMDLAPAAEDVDDYMGLDEQAVMLAEDDTFNLQRRRGLPGAFDAQEEVFDANELQQKSFLGVSSADSAPTDVRLSLEDQYAGDMGDEYDLSEDEDMARSSVGQHHAAELEEASSEDGQDIKRETPGGILRARMRAVKDSAGPVRLEVPDGDDWAEMLRKTVSPIKRDRQLLRELNESPSKVTGYETTLDNDDNFGKSSVWGKRSTAKADKKDGFAGSTMGLDKNRGFATSIDLMNSLFEKPKPTRENLRASQSAKGFPKVGALVVS